MAKYKWLFLMMVAVFLLTGCRSDFDSDFEEQYLLTKEKVLPGEVETGETKIQKAFIQEEFKEKWEYYNLSDDVPIIDWESSGALFIGMGESGTCPVIIEKMVVGKEKNTLLFDTKNYEVCTADLHPRTIVLQLNRTLLENTEYIRFGDERMEVEK